jgi:hypothetical protein
MIRLQIITLLFQLAIQNVEADTTDLLFVIKRSTNANYVNYVANLSSKGEFDGKEPVSAYWTMAAEDGHREELTGLEREHAYGFTTRRDVTGTALILITKAMDKIPIRVFLNGGIARAEMEISGHPAFLKQVFVQASHGLFPGVDWIELSGIDTTTGVQIKTRVRP